MKILLSNSKINYKASIYFDRNKIKSDLAADKRLTENDYGKINKVLDEVDSFSRMPQTSVVETISRNDNNMINLISYVSDEKSTITRMISERSVRKMVADDEFASRYTEKIKQAIIGILFYNFCILQKRRINNPHNMRDI